jgi:NAD(P)H-dependent FMN reductase
MIKIGIILGSTRPNRSGEQVATWVHDLASRRSDAEFELLDLRDYPLPYLDETLPPSMGQYQNEHTKQWAATIASFDGFIMVTPEYNHSTSAALKNALDYLYAEWNNKAAGFVSYGLAGGARAAEHLLQARRLPRRHAGHADRPGHRLGHRARAAAHRLPGRSVRLVHQLDDEFRREAVRLMQIPQVRLCQGPSGAELGQQLAASGEQACELAFLAAEHIADHAVLLALAELR